MRSKPSACTNTLSLASVILKPTSRHAEIMACRNALAGIPCHPSVLMCLACSKSSSKSRAALARLLLAWLPSAIFDIMACMALPLNRACTMGAVPRILKMAVLMFAGLITTARFAVAI